MEPLANGEICCPVIEPIVEDTVNESLENCRHILELEWHDIVLEEIYWCFKGRLPFVAFPDLDVV